MIPQFDPDKVLIISPSPFIMEPLEGKNTGKVFETARKILTELGVTFWLSSGSLIGMYRDKEFIPDDSDIDIDCIIEDNKILSIFYAFYNHNFRIARILVYDNKIMQIAFMDNEQNIIIDLLFYR